MVGDDALFARARAQSIPGGISGVASAVPELMVALNRSIAGGHSEKANLLDRRLQEFLQRIACFPVPVGVKEAAAMRGIKCTAHSVPFSAAQQVKRDEFCEWFKSWLPLVQKECAAA